MNLTKSLLLSSFILLTGCSLFSQPETVVETRILERDIPVVERPTPLDLKKIKFKVITLENLEAFIEELEKEKVYIIMTVKDYEILATNIADLKKYILEQKRIIVYYEESIKKD